MEKAGATNPISRDKATPPHDRLKVATGNLLDMDFSEFAGRFNEPSPAVRKASKKLAILEDQLFYFTNSVGSEYTGSFYRRQPPKQIEEVISLSFLRLVELQHVFKWGAYAVHCNEYRSAFREMRFILDAIVHAIVTDRGRTAPGEISPYKDLFKHVEKLELEKPRFSDLCKRLGDPRRKAIYRLFRDLCKFVHPSAKEVGQLLRLDGIHSTILRGQDEEFFLLCTDYWARTVDACLYLLLRRFPNAQKNFARKVRVKERLALVDLPLVRQLLYGEPADTGQSGKAAA